MKNDGITDVFRDERALWKADLGNGYYKNPILYADYSDPDVIRVGEDFYMIASSFHMSPCLPILHSKDLVNWTLIHHVMEKLPYSRYDLPRHGEGVWAPSIRYHDGEYWIFFATPDEGVFMCKTNDPSGKWSEPHLVKEAKGWIDPCPFWDNDGNAYLVHAFAKSRSGIKSQLQICKMKQDGTGLLDEGKIIFNGKDHHPTIEGPKMYKRNGYYYIFAPAGGVTDGWQTVLRSESIMGPYQDKVVLEQGDTDINGPHQGGWVETKEGESWFIHFQDKGAYGRITHLQPLYWKKDWPVIGEERKEGVGEPVLSWKKPKISHSAIKNEIIVPQTSDMFDKNSLGLQWQWQANQKRDWWEVIAKENRLRLHAISTMKKDKTLYNLPHILTQKFSAPAFTATTSLFFQPQMDNDYAGLIVLGQRYKGITVKRYGAEWNIVIVDGEHTKDTTREHEEIVYRTNDIPRYFRVEVKSQAVCQFAFSTNGEQFISVGDLFQATPGRWIGAQLGIFCVHKGEGKSSGYTDFHWLQLTNE
ncbi:glycoside hydrolase [Salibacterium salarium]|uniref:Glycoside hydrolase n=1 Tax=Salibacterium salarium TaxID=284579 RepID=A0A428NAD4_9BACI|nr:glycoside hydrolase 43 family protein [Salibacterium salarium]RSL35338.1 glycoside hydrolase [Salibacterium salarium]